MYIFSYVNIENKTIEYRMLKNMMLQIFGDKHYKTQWIIPYVKLIPLLEYKDKNNSDILIYGNYISKN